MVSGISVVLVVLVLAFGLRAALDGGAVEVPAVRSGASAAETLAALRAVDLVAVQEQVPSATVQAGAVVELQPAPGSEVDEGSTVTVVVSTGPAPDSTVGEDDR